MRIILKVLLIAVAITASPLHPKRNTSERLYNGSQASVSEFPYQVYIRVNRGELGPERECTGAILSTIWILTSASCIVEGQFAVVQAGSNTIYTVDTNRQTIQSSKLHIHTGFDHEREAVLQNNIGLIRLASILSWTDTIQPIALAHNDTPVGTVLTVAGWGRSSTSSIARNQNYMYYITLKSISNNVCSSNSAYKGDLSLTDDIMCAVSTTSLGKFICEGDEGAPLVQEVDTRHTLVGISITFAWENMACDSALAPSGFVRVYRYLQWIKQISGLDV